ncbi:hypothetical protein E4U17_000360 [Claviceps sp. LM77 group G4]|nr:hypothetical protein E4U17_000360 [Claviceps sp. LM77 group G4]KAG6072874.1 hypothetical protein E4U33_003143 [Claviceps sp. LM78 group G4]
MPYMVRTKYTGHMLTKFFSFSVIQKAMWNARDGLCLAKPGFKFDGQPWENDCKNAIGEFYRVVTDDYGNESLDKSKKLTVGAATGWCPDKVE